MRQPKRIRYFEALTAQQCVALVLRVDVVIFTFMWAYNSYM